MSGKTEVLNSPTLSTEISLVVKSLAQQTLLRALIEVSGVNARVKRVDRNNACCTG